MYLFDGKHQKKKVVSLRGRSRTNKAKGDTLQGARAARAERAAQRSQVAAAGKIQKVYRSYACRESLKQVFRERFDTGVALRTHQQQQSSGENRDTDVGRLCSLLVFFYHPTMDVERMEYLCAQIIQEWLPTFRQQNESIPRDEKLFRQRKIRQVLILLVRYGSEQNLSFLLTTISELTDRAVWGDLLVMNVLCENGLLKILVNAQSSEPSKASLTEVIFERALSQSDNGIFVTLAVEYLTMAESSGKNNPFLQTLKTDFILCKRLCMALSSSRDVLVSAVQGSQFSFLFANIISVAVGHIGSWDIEFTKSLMTIAAAIGKRIQQKDWDISQGLDPNARDSASDESDLDASTNMDVHDPVVELLHSELVVHLGTAIQKISNQACLKNFVKVSNQEKMEDTVEFWYMLLSQITDQNIRISIINMLELKSNSISGIWSFLKENQEDLRRFKDGKLQNYEPYLAAIRIFSDVFNHSLLTLDDQQFYAGGLNRDGRIDLSLPEVVMVSSLLKDIAVGLYLSDSLFYSTKSFDALRKSMSKLLRQLFLRDSKQRFCPKNHWLSQEVVDLVRGKLLKKLTSESFQDTKVETKSESQSDTSDVVTRAIRILKTLPFVVPFDDRAVVFHHLVSDEYARNQVQQRHVFEPNQFFTIRRDHLYEDAFDKLNGMGQGLRQRVRVLMVNEMGLSEAGIDGGGVFRDFLESVLKKGFDPDAGMFCPTPDNRLYPNPEAFAIVDDEQYKFLGRMLGKALYDGMLVEIPLAIFFLTKVLGDFPYLNDLASLDPEMHRNLMLVKNYEGDVSDLCLDFSVALDRFGNTVVYDLIPNGRDISVTNENRIKFVYYMANFKLNKQIERQCRAFREGLFDVIDRDWLVMFSPTELQQLISGAEKPIDIEDLRKHVVYGPGFHSDHEYIQSFWRVVEGFTNEQRQDLLKFTTSCRLPPLLGYAHLQPQFGIAKGGEEDDDRLPTASTCMNLLKLPVYSTEEILREKLLYAITSQSGFELS